MPKIKLCNIYHSKTELNIAFCRRHLQTLQYYKVYDVGSVQLYFGEIKWFGLENSMFNTMYTTIHLIESIFLFLLLYMAFSQENRKLLQLLLELLQVYRYRKRIHIISVIQYQLLTTKSKYINVFHNISFQASKPFWWFQVMVVPQMRSLLILLSFFNACLFYPILVFTVFLI